MPAISSSIHVTAPILKSKLDTAPQRGTLGSLVGLWHCSVIAQLEAGVDGSNPSPGIFLENISQKKRRTFLF